MVKSYGQRLKRAFFGKPRNLFDEKTFHNITLIAVLAWIGLGGDGLSSSCYGPEEAYLALGEHAYLAVFLALAVVITIAIISFSYTRIIEHFPSGGGGYTVATKLISPTAGMVAGSALIVDYILTVAISIAAGASAVFSFLPPAWGQYKFYAITLILAGMVLLNLRGIREAVLPLVPIFGLFVVTHLFAVSYATVANFWRMDEVAGRVLTETHTTVVGLGLFGVFVLLMRAYSLGAGTFTGIEAVSNSLPILRAPKVETARKTITLMAISLSVVAAGLIVAFLIFDVTAQPGKTLNAVLFGTITGGWPPALARGFLYATLASEAAILIVAAQTGFLDGPRVMSYMALDNWMPRRFANFSERLVTQDGVVVMGVVAFFILLFTGASVKVLVVLYAINVFITFTLSQFGMSRYLWRAGRRERHRIRDLAATTVGFCLTGFILVNVVVLKFHEGGWATLLVTGAVITLCVLVKRHYRKTAAMLSRLDVLREVFETEGEYLTTADTEARARSGITAVLLVNGYNGLGLHLLSAAFRVFGGRFRKVIFLEIGVVDAGRFKGVAEVANLERYVADELAKYVGLMKRAGYDAEAVSAVGTDVPEEVERLAEQLREKYSGLVFFVGQLMFEEETPLTRFLHSYTAFAVQKRLYRLGLPLVTLPVRVAAA